MPERVAVIGGGATGLAATKVLIEDGFEVTSYEARPYVGGLWKDNHDSTLSVQSSTIFNTSKFRVAFSDYPFSESTDTYPTASQIYEYLNAYADHFNIRKCYRLSSKVQQIFREDDEWILEVTDQNTGITTRNHFDRICTATGTFFSPRFPVLEGLEHFEGRVLHSIDFHDPEEFRDQNVLCIGLHATTQDITNVLSGHAKHLYLSHRRGIMLLPRFTDDGGTLDTSMKLSFVFIQGFLEKWVPALWFWILTTVCKKAMKKAFGDIPDQLGLTPPPSVAVNTPVMADIIFQYLKSGFAEPVSTVKQIRGPKVVELSDGRILDDVDSIIYCTGYDSCIPPSLIPKSAPSQSSPPSDTQANSTSTPVAYDPYPSGPGTAPYLYMYIFPMTKSPVINNSLAFMSQGATHFPGFVQQELQASAISQIWKGRHHLPAQSEMLKWHAHTTEDYERLGAKYNATKGGTYYPLFLPFHEYFPWLNRMAGTGVYDYFGGKFNGLFNWKCWKLWWQDREMYDLCTKGLFSPTLFRVFDVGGRKALDWEDAKKRLKWDNEIFEKTKKAKKVELDAQKEKEMTNGTQKVKSS